MLVVARLRRVLTTGVLLGSLVVSIRAGEYAPGVAAGITPAQSVPLETLAQSNRQGEVDILTPTSPGHYRGNPITSGLQLHGCNEPDALSPTEYSTGRTSVDLQLGGKYDEISGIIYNDDYCNEAGGTLTISDSSNPPQVRSLMPPITVAQSAEYPFRLNVKGVTFVTLVAYNGAGVDIVAIATKRKQSSTPPSTSATPTATVAPPKGTPLPTGTQCTSREFSMLYRCTENSILRLTWAPQPGNIEEGTGFVIRSDASGTYVLTAKHVLLSKNGLPVSTSNLRVITPDGKTTFHPVAIQSDPGPTGTANDLAVVELQATALHALTWGNSDQLQPGQQVAAIGYGDAVDLSGPPSYHVGVISQLNRKLACSGSSPWIQHQVPLNPGDSGSPLLNQRGEVIGVNILSVTEFGLCQDYQPTPSDNPLSFAIPSNLVAGLVNDLINDLQHGAVSQQASHSEIGANQIGTKLYRKDPFGFQLPLGWRVLPDKQARPYVSKDGEVSLSVGTKAVGRVVPTSADLRQQARGILQTLGVVSSLGVQQLTTDSALPGTQISATFSNRRFQADVTWLIDRSDARGFTILRLIEPQASPRDVQESDIIINTLHVLS